MPKSDIALIFVDDKQNYCGDVLDLIVSLWRQGEIPEQIDEHELCLKVPQGWYQYWKNKPVKVISIRAKIVITTYIIEFIGEAKRFRLIDAETKKSEKFRLDANFNAQDQMEEIAEKFRNGFEATFVRTEEELSEILNKAEIRVFNKIRLPRIIGRKCFHPISERVAKMTFNEVKGKSLDEIDKLPPLSFEECEGKVIGSIHEKPLRGFPVIVNDEIGNTFDLRLLLRNKEYQKVIGFKNLFEEYSTPEFAEILQIANIEIGRQVLGIRES